MIWQLDEVSGQLHAAAPLPHGRGPPVRMSTRLGGYSCSLYLRKVAVETPDEVNDFFLSNYLILPAVLGPGVHSTCSRNEDQKQKNNAICEPIV
jgi:hypothetical protein